VHQAPRRLHVGLGSHPWRFGGELRSRASSLTTVALAAIAVFPAFWRLAPLLGFAAAGCTGPAALHLWRHYEGEVVSESLNEMMGR
jgi:hypothetical protein